MKCIYCKQEADYVLNGSSMCDSHFNQYSNNGDVYVQRYSELMDEYKGKKWVIDKFFNEAGKQVLIKMKDRCWFIKRILKIPTPIEYVDKAILVACSKKVFKMAYIYTLAIKIYSGDNTDTSNVNSNVAEYMKGKK